MTATPTPLRTRRMSPRDVRHVTRLLTSGWGAGLSADAPAVAGMLAHQVLLDAIDKGEIERFHLWPSHDPVGIIYCAAGGTVMPVGEAHAGPALADAADRFGWRVLLGTPAVSDELLGATPRGLLRRRPESRLQRLMVAAPDVGAAGAVPTPAGFRPARRDDVDALADFACKLHVEDRMGPAIPRSGQAAIWGRMLDSTLKGATWVVERGGHPVAKVDVSLRSATRGAQIAGVYVDREWRGRGIGAAAVSHLARTLIGAGSVGVALHVREDNQVARRAYQRAGFVDVGAYRLALR